jgi:hypothetical protein
MNKKLIAIVSLAAMLSAMTPVFADGGTQVLPLQIGPIGGQNTPPAAYMAFRGLNIGIDMSGNGQSINPTDIRSGFYAFTGENIYYYVLAHDDAGFANILRAYWTRDGNVEEGPCADITTTVQDTNDYAGDYAGTKAQFCYSSSPTDPQCVNINKATNLVWDDQTDKLFECTLTVESGWKGTGQIAVTVQDQQGATGSTLPETWTFNPSVTVDISTSDGNPLTFGAVQSSIVPGDTSPNCVMASTLTGEDPTHRDCSKYIELNMPTGQKACNIAFSTNNMIIKNNGIVDLWTYIAGKDFYNSASGLTKCPFTNQLGINQFEYRSLQGSFDSGWRVLPEYSENLGCSGTGANGQCDGGCRITIGNTLNTLDPTQSISTQFKIVYPTPCIGTFDKGSIFAIVRAV